MSFLAPDPEWPADAPQSPAAADICRGVGRLLRAHGMATLMEVPLANGRRVPADTGLIVADRYGGEIVREAPEHRLPGARRKALTLKLVHTAALRLQAVLDPEG
jgi:hypothetical protein